MIILIEPSNYHLHQEDLEGMYRLRHQVFYEELKWQVNSSNGLEKDEYDENNTYYLVFKDDDGKIRGCQRYIEMNNPCMFDGPFKFMLEGLQHYKRRGFWEASRLAIDTSFSGTYTLERSKIVCSSILAASMLMGLELLENTEFITLSYPSVAKLSLRKGLNLTILKEGTVNDETIVVSSYPPSQESLKKMLRDIGDPEAKKPLIWHTGGIHSVFAQEHTSLLDIKQFVEKEKLLTTRGVC